MNDDTISRAAAIDILDAYQVMVENGEENPYAWARLRMSELPSAQPERKTGRWMPKDHNKRTGMALTLVFYYPKCSECGHSGNYTNFCPRCGADMRGEQDG